jgi:transcriptional regulator with XRE-family HTH domain
MKRPSSEIRALMRTRGLTQAELAREAGVSQATVSRALQHPTIRTGQARARLFNYIQKKRPRLPEVAAAAIATTWDGTDAHAQALAELILVSGQLWPKLGEE